MLEPVRRDLDHVLELGELEDIAEHRRTRDEVALDAGLPGQAVLDPVKLVLLVRGHFVVEYWSIFIADRADWAAQPQRDLLASVGSP